MEKPARASTGELQNPCCERPAERLFRRLQNLRNFALTDTTRVIERLVVDWRDSRAEVLYGSYMREEISPRVLAMRERNKTCR